MSRRARAYLPAREAKHAAVWSSPVAHDFDDEPDDGSDAGPLWSCPGCCKARAEPFHCTPCNADAEGPGDDD